MIREDFLWTERYRPRKIDDCILPDELKKVFSEFVKKGTIPNMLLCGKPGTGKTTVARAMCEELGSDYIIINGSMNGGIDTLRNDIKNFASTVSFAGGRKVVILDEADYLNATSTQPALRNFMEEYSKNCAFILTCNFKNKIIEPLHSRCTTVEFRIPNEEKNKLAGEFYKRAVGILKQENVEYDKNVVGELILKFFPDWRRVLNEMQRYSVSGRIDTGILSAASEEKFGVLIDALKNKRFTEMRKWVGENLDSDSTTLFRRIYDAAIAGKVKKESLPILVLILAEYSYKAAFVADQELNLVACLTQVMSDVEFA